MYSAVESITVPRPKATKNPIRSPRTTDATKANSPRETRALAKRARLRRGPSRAKKHRAAPVAANGEALMITSTVAVTRAMRRATS